jgi:predicted metal-dependent enzyme (double-stranded beta helix superfamily)
VRSVLRQLPDALDPCLAALVHDICRPELPPERRPSGVAAEQDDPVGAEALRCDHTAEPDGAVADYGDGLAGSDLRRQGSVVAGAHHIGECEQRRHQGVVRVHRQRDQRSVRLRHAYRLALTAVDTIDAVPASVEAFALHAFPAEDARSVRPEKRRNDQVAGVDRLHIGADCLDDSDELVPHPPPGVGVRHRLVRPQVAPADRGSRHTNESICGVDQASVRDILDPDVAGFVHDGCAHEQGLPTPELRQYPRASRRNRSRLPDSQMCELDHDLEPLEHDEYVLDTPEIRDFIERVRRHRREAATPAEAVKAIEPDFTGLMQAQGWLPDEYQHDAPESSMGGGIGQWLLFRAADRSLSLFSLVVPAGSLTPIHDHLAWGLIGLYRGNQDEEFYRPEDGRLVSIRRRSLEPGVPDRRRGRGRLVRAAAAGARHPSSHHHVRGHVGVDPRARERHGLRDAPRVRRVDRSGGAVPLGLGQRPLRVGDSADAP